VTTHGLESGGKKADYDRCKNITLFVPERNTSLTVHWPSRKRASPRSWLTLRKGNRARLILESFRSEVIDVIEFLNWRVI